jgi:hypothetical protein
MRTLRYISFNIKIFISSLFAVGEICTNCLFVPLTGSHFATITDFLYLIHTNENDKNVRFEWMCVGGWKIRFLWNLKRKKLNFSFASNLRKISFTTHFATFEDERRKVFSIISRWAWMKVMKYSFGCKNHGNFDINSTSFNQ